jgi:hypothetical protein
VTGTLGLDTAVADGTVAIEDDAGVLDTAVADGTVAIEDDAGDVALLVGVLAPVDPAFPIVTP